MDRSIQAHLKRRTVRSELRIQSVKDLEKLELHTEDVTFDDTETDTVRAPTAML